MLDKYDSSKTIKSISSDGTPVNTGLDNGANRILEELVDMALQWLVCDLHCNELLFRHLFCKIGKQTRPKTVKLTQIMHVYFFNAFIFSSIFELFKNQNVSSAFLILRCH